MAKVSVTVTIPTPKAYQLALRWFLLLNIIYIVVGISLGVLYQYMRVDKAVHHVLYFYSDYKKSPVLLVTTSAAVLTVTGVFGVLLRFYERPYLFDSYEGYLLVALCLNIVGASTAAMIPARIIKSVYETSFRAEVLHMIDHNRYISICHNQHMWDVIQRDIHCCGISDPRDWIMSTLNSVPRSCCNVRKVNSATCKKVTGLGSVRLGHNIKEINDKVYPKLYQKSCIQKFQELTAKRKALWTYIPLAIVVFELILIALTSHVVDTIRLYCDYKAEENEKVQAGNPELVRLKAKQKKRKVIPESNKQSIDSIP